MNHQAALDYIYSFVRYSTGGHQKGTPYEVAVARIRHILHKLGNPQQAYPIVHVAGTKGKGSVSAMLASILGVAGYQTGLYTSPHLQDIRERFRINQTIISSAIFTRLVEQIKPALADIEKPAFFEVITALALLYFAHEQVDVAIIETGIGGLRDATNVVQPQLSIITSLSMDHMESLGDTIEAIAAEKAGIIKPLIPVISAPQPLAALAVLEAVAQQKQAAFTLVGRDWVFDVDPDSQATPHQEGFLAAPSGETPRPYATALIGHQQVINSVVAIAAVHQLAQAGFQISDEQIRRGLQEVNWAGRMEVIRQADGFTTVLDAAHNEASALHLTSTLMQRYPDQHPRVLVFGAKGSKDIATILKVLLPIADHLIITQASSKLTAAPDVIAEIVHEIGYARSIDLLPDVPDALTRAAAIAGQEGLMCVTGSVYIVGEARTFYQLEPGQVNHLPE